MISKTKYDEYKESAFKLMEQKNAAYSSTGIDNIKLTGELGVAVRILDKALRYYNLVTNKSIEIGDEAVKDTLRDLGNYSVIGLALNLGDWSSIEVDLGLEGLEWER